LVGTTLQVIRQERELSERRREEERRVLALRLGQAMVDNLRLLDRELDSLPLGPREIIRFQEGEPALLTVASLQNQSLIYPWEMESDPEGGIDPARLTRYQDLLTEGEQAEYREGRFWDAAESYGEAAGALGREPWGPEGPPEARGGGVLQAEAMMHRARALLRAERPEQARGVLEQLLTLPPDLTDREGLPFRVYAVDALHPIVEDPRVLLAPLVETGEAWGSFSSPALVAWMEVAEKVSSSVPEGGTSSRFREAGSAVAERLETLRKLEDLRQDLPGLLATDRRRRGSTSQGPGPVWIPFGDDPWLVGIREISSEESVPLVIVLPSVLLQEVGHAGEDLAEVALGARLCPVGEDGGESLGTLLGGLTAFIPSDLPPQAEGGLVEGWFYRLLLPVILTLTAFTAYLAWRDVRREAQAARLRSQFVSSVTHELKTPLTSIRMFAETLRLGRHSGPEAQKEYLDTVVHETERLSRLINNVLDFARIDRGEMAYHMGTTDLKTVVEDASKAVAYPLAQGRYSLTVDVAEDLPGIHADPDALIQALLNLLSNAIKFSPEETEICVRAFREDGEILLQVRDEGRGISIQDQRSIFQDFFRSAGAEEEGIPGTGLGLSLVAHVAEAHGGTVQVVSQLGEGSTFTIRLPLDRGAGEQERPRARSAEAGPSAPNPGGAP
jgi:signal transduction histidine kinase